MPESSHPLVRLAEEAIISFVLYQRRIEAPRSLFDEFPGARDAAGAFVCLKREGVLRGCIGTTEPTSPTLAEEIIHNAIGAATRDPRFPPLDRTELDALLVSIDVLGRSEPVENIKELDHRRYGIILRSSERHSVLLPDIEGVNSVVEQMETARQKGGFAPEERLEVFRFEVTRYY